MVALRVISELLKTMAVKLVVVGAGDLLEAMHKECARLGIQENVQFLGALPQTALPELYARSELLLMTSRSEGIPVVLMEALAMRVPVVAPDVDGIPELVVDGQTGLLVQPGDVQAFAAACRSLLNDQELRASIGERGRELVLRNHNAAREARVLAKALLTTGYDEPGCR